MQCTVETMSRGCGCGSPRHFLTKKEKVEGLEKIKEELQKEINGIDELIKELSS